MFFNYQVTTHIIKSVRYFTNMFDVTASTNLTLCHYWLQMGFSFGVLVLVIGKLYYLSLWCALWMKSEFARATTSKETYKRHSFWRKFSFRTSQAKTRFMSKMSIQNNMSVFAKDVELSCHLSSVVGDQGRPESGLPLPNSPPIVKALYHLKTCVWDKIVFSNIRNDFEN